MGDNVVGSIVEDVDNDLLLQVEKELNEAQDKLDRANIIIEEKKAEIEEKKAEIAIKDERIEVLEGQAFTRWLDDAKYLFDEKEIKPIMAQVDFILSMRG